MRLWTIKIQLAFFLCAFFFYGAASAAEPVTLSLNTSISSDGVAQITWQLPASSKIILEQSSFEDFSNAKIIYSGFDDATVLTGLLDGDYYFRARLHDDEESVWGPVVQLSVKHHSLMQAFTFFLIGLVVFVATLLLIVFGSKNQQAAA